MSLLLTALLVLALGTGGVYAAKAFQLGKFLEKGDILNSDGDAVLEQDSSSGAADGLVITAPFAEENPHTGFIHDGIDFMAEEGTPVLAAASGQIMTAEFDAQKGNYIVIDHGSGYTTVYSHLKELKVAAGDSVEAGNEIGTVGKTGTAVGPHLHLELWLNDEAVNPEDYWE